MRNLANYHHSKRYYDRREALGIWKSRLGSGATYRALIEVFFKAGRLDYADAVCSLLKDSIDTRGKTNNIGSSANCVIPSPTQPLLLLS